MAIQEPESMEECLYFTRRTFEEGGSAVAWVRKQKCPKCGKGLMAKPLDPKTGRPKIRSEDYECPSCGYTASKAEYEPTLQVEIKYTCSKCGKSGETTTQYKRKSFQGVPAYVFQCTSCGEKMGLTKKMRAIKKKGEPDTEDL